MFGFVRVAQMLGENVVRASLRLDYMPNYIIGNYIPAWAGNMEGTL